MRIYMAALVASQVAGPLQSKSALLGPGSACRMDSSSVLGNPITSAASWSFNTVPPVCGSQVTKGFSCSSSWIFYLLFLLKIFIVVFELYFLLDDAVLVGPTIAQNCCYTSGNESTHLTLPVSQPVDWGNHGKPTRGLYIVSFLSLTVLIEPKPLDLWWRIFSDLLKFEVWWVSIAL